VRVAVLAAVLVEGGTWRERMVFREPLADPVRHAPASASAWGCCRRRPSRCAGGRALRPAARRRSRPVRRRRRSAPRRLREAIRQARAVAGPEAALRVLTVDPDSRVPERRAVLTPFEL